MWQDDLLGRIRADHSDFCLGRGRRRQHTRFDGIRTPAQARAALRSSAWAFNLASASIRGLRETSSDESPS
jgi:hypothetical protein